MAVTPVQFADQYALVGGGRMEYTFKGEGRLATPGLKAVNELVFSGAVLEYSRIELRWNGITTTLIAKKSPAAPDEIPSGTVTPAYVDALFEQLASYFPIQEDFTVQRGPTVGPNSVIILTAKAPGSQFNLQASSAPGCQVKNATAGADPVYRPNYSVYLELWALRGDQRAFQRVDSAFLVEGKDGLFHYDAGEVLADQLAADLPAWHFPQPVAGTQSHCSYYVTYSEAYGSPVRAGRVQRIATRYAYLGGLDYRHKAGAGKALTEFTQLAGAGGTLSKALRTGSATRYVRLEEPQFLSFINTGLDLPAGVQVQVVMRFSDNTEQPLLDLFPRQDYPLSAKLTIPVGAAQLGLPAKVPAGKVLREYTVQLVGVLDASPVYRFIIDGRYEPYTRYFVYLSSLGVLETLATFGKGSAELLLFGEQASRYLPARYEVSDGQFVPYDLQTQQQLSVATGFRSAAELRQLNDFYRSPLKLHLLAGEALPIGVISKSIKQAKDGDTLFAHSFELQYLFQDDYYTALEQADGVGEPLPGPGFVPVGNLTITPAVVVPSVDPTVPDVARALTPAKILSFEVAKAQIDLLAAKKLLDEATGSTLFRRTDQKINYATDVAGKPTSRDSAGLSDVPTVQEARASAVNLFPLQLELSSSLKPGETGIRVRKPIGADWEYSLDKVSWQTQPVFTRQVNNRPFTEGQPYTLYARNLPLEASVQGSIDYGAPTNLDGSPTLAAPLRWGRGTVLDPVLKNFSDDFPDFA